MTTVTATFTKDTYVRGETITANFTWSGAMPCLSTPGSYVIMRILLPSGAVVQLYLAETPAGSYTLNYPTGSSTPLGTFTAPISANNNLILCSKTVGSDTCTLTAAYPDPTASISFPSYGCTGVPGSNVTANLQWSGAYPCTYEGYTGQYAYGYMVNPNGSTCDGPYAWTSSVSGPNIFLTCPGSVAGTYTAHLYVFKHDCTTLHVTNTCVVNPGGHTLTLAVTPVAAVNAGCWVNSTPFCCYTNANPCSCSYPSGQVVTLTAVGGGGYQFDHWTGGCTGASPTCSVTMSSDKTVTAVFVYVPPTVIGYINEASSTFYSGPFPPGTSQTVASVRFGNSGNATGEMNVVIYEYYSGTWHAIRNWNRSMAPGTEVTQGMSITTSTTQGTWYLGVKVWGATESEPSFGLDLDKTFMWEQDENYANYDDVVIQW